MKKKSKQNSAEPSLVSKEESPLAKLAHDFKGFDEQEALCQKKNDGTD
jgi:hypothetical protein